MNPEFSIGKLRKIAPRLRTVPYDRTTYYNRTVAPQEALDYLAMLAGIKPVYLLGRGFDDVAWAQAIAALSRELALNVRIGPALDPPFDDPEVPAWYREYVADKLQRAPVIYISRNRATADRVGELLQRGEITAEDEAELLGFPLCCVREHHRMRAQVDRAEYRMAYRTAGGDEETIKRIVDGELDMTPASEDEVAALNPEWVMCPFTSFFMCHDCRSPDGTGARADSPAHRISQRQARLAKRISPDLFQALKAISEESPVYRAGGASAAG